MRRHPAAATTRTAIWAPPFPKVATTIGAIWFPRLSPNRLRTYAVCRTRVQLRGYPELPLSTVRFREGKPWLASALQVGWSHAIFEVVLTCWATQAAA